ncbi:hypothetical protein BGW39_005105 [Mortierella sp. 14UC]|nr:hypothetical protein BGW39_005105 [Mortierella sp. 14UC]
MSVPFPVFSIPFWILSAVITLIKIILSGTIGALLAFYIRHSHDSYASSIRWSRTGGVFEAVTLLRNSGRQLTTQSSIVATMTILASLFSLVASILLGALVSRADKSFDKGPLSVFTEQLISTDSLFWTAYMQADATAKETLMSTLNDTRRNPNPVPRTRYIPRTYDYEVACDDTAVIFGSTVENGLVYPPQVKCKTHMMIVNNETYAWDPATAFTDLIAPKTIMVATPVVNVEGSMAFNLPYIYFLGGYNSSICVRTPGLDLGLRFKIAPKDGLVSPPRTDATKCQLGSDKSIVLSATYIPFIVNHLNDFDKVTTSLFDDPLHLPLLQSMSVAISNGTFSESTGNQTMVMLINMSTTTDCLVCISTLLNPPSNDTGLLCTYMATAMITINPQEWDPIMAAYLNRTSTPPVKPSSTISTLDFAIYHLPKISGSKDTTATLSAAHLLQATTEAAGYLASLGHNVFVDTKGRTESEGLYIIYDTVELKDAFEVPTIPLVIVVVITVVCALVWGVSEVCFTAVYNGSLYKVIYQEIKMKEKDTSMLMTCTHDPLSFDGFQCTNRSTIDTTGTVTGQDSSRKPNAVFQESLRTHYHRGHHRQYRESASGDNACTFSRIHGSSFTAFTSKARWVQKRRSTSSPPCYCYIYKPGLNTTAALPTLSRIDSN